MKTNAINLLLNQSAKIFSFFWKRCASEIDLSDIRGKTIMVFSPHPDDEILGCGGTIIKKKRAGANVKIIFMTDGCRSHQHLISKKKMRIIRSNEALRAGQMIGIKDEDIVFLKFEDGRLINNQIKALHKVLGLLSEFRPDEIFIPHRKELPPDHFSTNLIVKSALNIYGRQVKIFEFPVWLCCHWPFVNRPYKLNQGIFRTFVQSLVCNYFLIKDCRFFINISDVVGMKKKAMERYESQMTKLVQDSRWLTLKDISNGDFLSLFFRKYEVFYFYIMGKEKRKTNAD